MTHWLATAVSVKTVSLLWAYFLGVTVRGSLIVIFARSVLSLWSKASAAQRHLVWVITCGCLILLPGVQAVVPAWHVPVFSVQETDPAQSSAAQQGVTAVRTRVVPLTQEQRQVRDAAQWPLSKLGMLVGLVVWVSGAATGIALLLRKQRHMRQFVHGTTPVHEARTLAVLAHAHQSLRRGSRDVVIREHSVALPMVCGVWRPVIVLPADARDWSEARLRNVLLHELAHIERRDSVTQIMGAIAVLLCWYNPLAWFAARSLRIERERSCDDMVLEAGSSAREYATDLLDLTQTLQPIHAAALGAIPFARPSQLSIRVKAIIDHQQHRRPFSSWERFAVWSVGFGILGPMAGLHPEIAHHYRSGPPPITPSQSAPSPLVAPSAASAAVPSSLKKDTSSNCLSSNGPRSVGRNPYSPCRAAAWPAASDIRKYTLHPLSLSDSMKSKMRAAALASAATTLLAAAPQMSHAQASAMAVGVQGDSLTADQAQFVSRVLATAVQWRGDTLVIKADASKLIAAVPANAPAEAVLNDADLTQLALMTHPPVQAGAQGAKIPVLLEPGAPTVIVNGNVVTTDSFVIDASQQLSLQVLTAAAAKAKGFDAPNGVLNFTY